MNRPCHMALAAALLAAGAAAAEAPALLGGARGLALEDLPPGRFRKELEDLPAAARGRALDWTRRFEFPPGDAEALRASPQGAVYYVCTFPAAAQKEGEAPDAPSLQVAASAAVSPFPEWLKFHSRPGATNVLFLDFDGHNVTGTDWNLGIARDPIPAVAFSTDADYANFSDSEQAAIKSIWQRVAEDYAPFNVDVTTEEPAAITRWTARAVITRNTDADGNANPSSTAGGVAYVGIFGDTDNAYYSPAWVYVNRLGNSEANCAEAASHELGHNMGLSHDGTSAGGLAYYGGHGSGDISWGPIMGTGYGQNVSQWCRGEYYDANNTQDDLSIIAGRTGYRPDDHANTNAAATPLVVTALTNILATTPETDPDNESPVNKGVLMRTNDVDVFTFSCGPGQVRLTVAPWVNPASTRGGNLDLAVRLYDGGGALLTRVDPTSQTYAVLSVAVTGGVYYLHVGDTGTGDPLAASPSGYTAYGSVGQYFITGSIPVSTGVVVPPSASLAVSNVADVALTDHTFRVTYADDVAIDGATIDSADVRVTGPNGYSRTGTLVSVDLAGSGTPRTATYRVAAPGGEWSAGDNGVYAVVLLTGAVADVQGAFAPGGPLGVFTCAVPVLVYAADCSSDPGWAFTGTNWAFGAPAGLAGDPSSGATGPFVIGYNLKGAYPRTVTNETATTPPFSCAGADAVTVRYQRKLGTRTGDYGRFQVSTNGAAWTDVWSQGVSSSDTAWVAVSYDVTAWAAGATNVQLRWLMSANGNTSVSFGWNLDDVRVLASGAGVAPAMKSLAVLVEGDGAVETDTGPGPYALGATVALTAVPAAYQVFSGWAGDATGTANPVSIQMTADRVVTARFAAAVTAGHAVPYSWLASWGVTNAFEAGELDLGANGFALWESYVAGIEPADPSSQFLVRSLDAEGAALLTWSSVSGRVYGVDWAPGPGIPFVPLATNVPWPAASFTDAVHGAEAAGCYRLRVRLP